MSLESQRTQFFVVTIYRRIVELHTFIITAETFLFAFGSNRDQGIMKMKGQVSAMRPMFGPLRD